MFNNWIGNQRQNDEQRQGGQGDQGQQWIQAEQDGQIEKTETEVEQAGEGFADQKVAQSIELVEVIGDPTHRT